MFSTSAPMVMRSVYLPEDVDMRLREVAFWLSHPKADLIRVFVGQGLASIASRVDSHSENDKKSLLKELFGEADAAISKAEKRAFAEDEARIERALSSRTKSEP